MPKMGYEHYQQYRIEWTNHPDCWFVTIKNADLVIRHEFKSMSGPLSEGIADAQRWIDRDIAMHKVTLYTDGGCFPNPGPGGWACVLIHDASGRERELSGYDPDSTNNRMELRAAIEGLKALREPCEVTLITDSQYVQMTMSAGWKRKKNLDLWTELDGLCRVHSVTWQWTPGHAGVVYNERCDRLAASAAYRGKVGLLEPS